MMYRNKATALAKEDCARPKSPWITVQMERNRYVADGDEKKRPFSIDCLPVEVIGIILSHLEGPRHVARASATCRKWHEAASHHIKKLSFNLDTLDMCEIIISEAVMKTRWLQELSICVVIAWNRLEFQAAAVVAWLLHAKKTLRSLTFMNKITPKVNILEKLGGEDSKLEHLEWGYPYIPRPLPRINSLPCLHSLTLHSMYYDDEVILSVGTLSSVLKACPRLQSLFLEGIDVSGNSGTAHEPEVQPQGSYLIVRTEKGTGSPVSLEFWSTSLKNLSIKNCLKDMQHLILYIDGLEMLALEGVSLELVKLVQQKGASKLRHLLLKYVKITHIELGESTNMLHVLEFSCISELRREWPRVLNVFCGANKLRTLCLRSYEEPDKRSIELDKVASSFPLLCKLSLCYEHAFEVFEPGGCAESVKFDEVVVLSLTARRIHGPLFVAWIVEFLVRCPKLKRLRLAGTLAQCKRSVGCKDDYTVSSFKSTMIERMEPYSNISVEFSVI